MPTRRSGARGSCRPPPTGLDRPDELTATLRAARLRPQRIWPERLRRQWDRSSFLELASGGAANRVRLSLVDAATRTDVLARLRLGLERLAPADLLWEGEVICAIASR